ncbi:transposase [Xenorhabdus khoisanae]|uniref:transposase n=1 Tax=Xenorhabdus khoisanae TaxID=880157 RepID=UPI002285BC73|nr:transposase [Xenorhabdus khoisanae]
MSNNLFLTIRRVAGGYSGSYGLPFHFELSGDQVTDIVHVENFVSQSPLSDFVIADKGYGSQHLRNVIEEQESVSVIPYRKKGQKLDQKMDKCLYRYRHLMENAFTRIKHFRVIATRYDKLERNYTSMLALAFIIVWLPMWAE